MHKNNLKIVIEAALLAGREIMTVYSSKIEVFTKADDSPLTHADRKANAVIIDILEQTGIPIISEENKQLDYQTRRTWNRCWLVDPLDGTKEFIKRNGEFTVNIALIENGVPVLGVIYVPDSMELYYGDLDSKTAYKVKLSAHDTPLEEVLFNAKPIFPKEDTEYFRIVGSRSHLNQETNDFITGIDSKRNKLIVSKGSSLKFCLIAEGLADIYPRYAPTMEWDTAAGHAICEAVGIQVIALPEGIPLRYNKENLLNPSFLVSKSSYEHI